MAVASWNAVERPSSWVGVMGVSLLWQGVMMLRLEGLERFQPLSTASWKSAEPSDAQWPPGWWVAIGATAAGTFVYSNLRGKIGHVEVMQTNCCVF